MEHSYSDYQEDLNVADLDNLDSAAAVGGFDPNSPFTAAMDTYPGFQQQAVSDVSPYTDDCNADDQYTGMESISNIDPALSYGNGLVPVPSSHLRSLRNVYIESYSIATSPNATRMEHAKAFSVALLQQFYPEHEGYIIQPSTLGPLVKHGINFTLRAEDGTDPDYKVLPPKTYKKSNKKGLRAQREAEYLRQVAHYMPYTMGVRWHKIKPEDISGLEVLKKIVRVDDNGGTDVEYCIHTYMVIIIDDLQTFPFFAVTNEVHRADILADTLCRSQQIQSGHAILLFGSRLEFYDFENGGETEIKYTEDGEGSYEMEVNADDPIASISTDATGNELAVDLRTSDLQTVDHMFKAVVAREVVYIQARQEHAPDNSE